MGWWGYGVTDGDTPSDIMCDLKLAIWGEDPNDGEGPELSPEEQVAAYLAARETLRAFDWATKVQPIVDEWDGSQWESDGIVWQCLAMLYLEHELNVPADLKLKAIEACVNQATEADQFDDQTARREALNAFVKAVEADKRDGLQVSGLFWSAEMLPRERFD